MQREGGSLAVVWESPTVEMMGGRTVVSWVMMRESKLVDPLVVLVLQTVEKRGSQMDLN